MTDIEIRGIGVSADTSGQSGRRRTLNSGGIWRRRYDAAWLLLTAVLLAGLTATASAEDIGAFKRGVDHFGLGDYAAARAAFKDAIANDPASARAHYFIGLSEAKLGDHGTAATSFEKALSLDPERANAYLQLGITRYELKAYGAAANALDEAIRRLPDNANAYFFRGLVEQKLGQHASSIGYFESAMTRDTKFTQLALFNMGIARFRSGDNEAATAAFDRAVTTDPDSSTAGHARDFLARIEDTAEQKSKWIVNLGAGLKYDDRVTSSESDQDSGKGDIAAKFGLGLAYQLLDDDDMALKAGYRLGFTTYEDQTNFNLQTHSATLGASRKVGDAKLGLGYRYTRSFLGGFDFLGDHSLTPSIRAPITKTWFVSASYEFESKNFIENRDSDRDGIQHGLGVDNFFFFDNNQSFVLAGLLAELENTHGPQFDYRAATGKLEVVTPLNFMATDLTFKAGYKYRHRNYDNITAAIGGERLDNRHAAVLQLTHDINEDVELKAKYDYVNSISNQATVDYTKNVFGLSVEYQF